MDQEKRSEVNGCLFGCFLLAASVVIAIIGVTMVTADRTGTIGWSLIVGAGGMIMLLCTRGAGRQ